MAGPVVIICALMSELVHALHDVDVDGDGQSPRESTLGPWTVMACTIGGHDVRLVQSGIGMVNAAGAISALAAQEHPRLVLNYGCAGAHTADILPGDVVVAEACVAPGALTVLPNGEERYTGFFCGSQAAGGTLDALPTAPELLAEVRRAAQQWAPTAWPWRRPRQAENRVHFGVVASADCWTQHPARIAALHTRHRSLCEDMEAAALAQICARWDIPFLAVKDISNNELLDVTPLGADLPTLEPFTTEIGSRAWGLLKRALPRLGPA